MQKLSRTQKYEQLRQELQNNSEQEIVSESLSRYANRLNKIDSDTFQKMDVTADLNEQHNPVHTRREAYFQGEPEVQTEQPATFNNEYLDEYIHEVKQYNINKGLRSAEDTQVNILNGIRKEPLDMFNAAEKDSSLSFEDRLNQLYDHKFEPTKNEDKKIDTPLEVPSFSKDDEKRNTISMEIKNLLNEPVEKIEEVQSVVAPIEPKVADKSKVANPFENEKELREKLMNETVQLRVQLEEYEDELSDVNDSVNSTNRILNFILILLILALLVILGVVAYWVLLSRGVI